MLSKYIIPGQKMDIQSIEKSILATSSEKKNYTTKVYDILSDERIEILMPMEKTKLILLPLDGEYELFFYAKEGLYACFARVIDRYKSNNVYIVLCELTTTLRKHQRRDYYRYSCVLDLLFRPLEEKEVTYLEKNQKYFEENLPLLKGIIVDISGGGIRFISKEKYEKDTYIYLSYIILINGREKQYDLAGKILAVNELENRKDEYEYRIRYIDIMKNEQEEIIRYIFEEERKNRQKMKG